MTILHVSVDGSDLADGTQHAPLRTINKAAQLARPGDTVRVHAGTYREWVKPVRGGLSDSRRITFEAAAGEHVVIKGSERITTWVRETGTVWRARLPNSLFGDFNPFAETVDGDWVIRLPERHEAHLGEVYLNGRSFYEVASRHDVDNPVRRSHALDHWTGTSQPLPDPDQSVYVWYAQVDDEATTIWANFQGADPNEELVEINVRRSVFYPERPHLDYITVRGFELAQAASPWTPPTADQPGLIGPNWAKGWVIEDNVIHDAKCSAISLGKEISTGHNYSKARGDKPGYQYQLEAVFKASELGWSKEHIGSHVVRRNTVFDCGQNGVVGHLGCVFSTIEDNHIYNIGTKREFYGYEIGGIKLHAPIDVQIIHNRIHDTTLGIWLDWQVQGTRVARNVLYDNTRDLFVEVSHGPCLIDHNILASPAALEILSQGNAVVNNLIGGALLNLAVLDRATPYHYPHSTRVAGYGFIYSGDDRFIGNLFIGSGRHAYDVDRAVPAKSSDYQHDVYGTHGYDGFPASWEEYLQAVGSYDGAGDHARFHHQRQAAYIESNTYVGGARPFAREKNAVHITDDASFDVVDQGDQVYLDLRLPAAATAPQCAIVTGDDLGRVRIADTDFEQPDGTPVVADVDVTGEHKHLGTVYPAGPLASLTPSTARVRVW